MTQVSELLRTTLERLNLTQKRLSDDSGLPPRLVNAMANGRLGVSGRTALLLEMVTQVPASEWLLAEAKDQEERARSRISSVQQDLERYVRNMMNQTGVSLEESRLTARDKDVIKWVMDALGLNQ